MRKVFTLISIVLTALALALPLAVVDDLGRVVIFEKIPERVVCAAPSITRYLIHLGVEDRIVGVTDWDSYTGAERIGNMTPLNVEKIVSLEPDVVFLFGGFQAVEVKKLEKFNLKAFVVNPKTLSDIPRELRLLGLILGVKDEADEKAAELERRMTRVAKESYSIPYDERPRVLYLLGAPESGMKEFWTAVSGSYMNELINIAGGRNIASDVIGPNGWAPVSLEFILEKNPEVILVANFVPGGEEKVVEKVKSFSPFSKLDAVLKDRVFAVDGNLASQPSPQIFDLLEEIQGLLVKGR